MAELVGRDREHQLIADVLRDGGSLLLRGEPGAGKTALLDQAATAATVRVLRAAGVESVADIPYAAIAELLRPLRADLRERDDASALRMALGMEPANAGLSALAIEVALEDLLVAHAPLLVIVDDVQWLDDASARVIGRLGRGARELGITVLLAVRPEGFAASGVDELVVEGLDVHSSAALLRRVDPDLSPSAVAQLVDVTAGNPLGLVELPRALTAGQRDGVEPILASSGITSRLVAAFGDRIRRLPQPARLALIAAAASDADDARVLPAAFTQLGLAVDVLDPAERDGLLGIDDAIRFRHPLVRAAALGGCSATERRRVEAALANVVTDVERRTWHRANAAAGTDDELASDLVRVAQAAGARVAYTAQSRLLVEAARLSTLAEVRGQRLVDAAYAAWAGGSPRRSEDLLAAAEICDPASVTGTAGLFVRWRILKAHGETAAVPETIQRAAAASDDVPAELAVVVLRSAAVQQLQIADPDRAVAYTDAALQRAGDDPRLRFLAHEAAAMAYLHAGQIDTAVAHCEVALALVDDGFGHPDYVGTFGITLTFCEQYPNARRLLAAAIARHRRAGNPYFLARDLGNLATLLLRTGDLVAAQPVAQEAYDLAKGLADQYVLPINTTLLAYTRLLRGDREAMSLAEQADAADAEPSDWATTAATLAHGRLLAADPAGALAALAPIVAVEPHAYREPNHSRGLALCMEALIAADRRDEAADVLSQVEAAAAGASTRWTRSCAARFRGVLAEDFDTAEDAFAQALAELIADDGPVEHGLIRLDHGRWLRRAGRRREARGVLQQAHAEFTGCGAVAFAEVAAREIAATAARLRPRTDPTGQQLTVRETEIAQRAAAGASDREIAVALYISVRTVDYHLRNVFRKLGVRTRGELAGQMPAGTREPSGG